MRKLIKQIAKIIEMRFVYIITALLVASFLAPVFVSICYNSSSPIITTKISADGMLSYIGSFLGGLVTLITACIAVVQGKKAIEAEEERTIQRRKEEIRPSLQLCVQAKSEGLFDITVQNLADRAAVGVYIYDYSLFPLIKPGACCKKTVSFGVTNSNYLVVDEFYFEKNDAGYPKIINLIYGDIDNNIISQDYRLCSGNIYEPLECEYY